MSVAEVAVFNQKAVLVMSKSNAVEIQGILHDHLKTTALEDPKITFAVRVKVPKM